MKLSYPIVPEGSFPPCFNCGAALAPASKCHTGYSHGNGAQSAVCRQCGMTTYFDVHPLKFVRRVEHTRRGRNLWRLIASERMEAQPVPSPERMQREGSKHMTTTEATDNAEATEPRYDITATYSPEVKA